MRLSYGAGFVASKGHEQHLSEAVLMHRPVNFAFPRKYADFVEKFELMGRCGSVNFVKRKA
ncbi:MAG: hypothetical protein B7Y88_01575 [Sphingomonadales bacterium 32-64-17]|nr:MAG: hypothetical protein B7Y88_01575 [Sphingomonadales bacterium 32-64-17]